MSEKLYIAYGAGADKVGLVEKITSGIAGAGGNITDLRQDSLHGLFTVYLVADLANTKLGKDQFADLIREIGEDTGLSLHTERFVPQPRVAGAKNLLIVLLGEDKPGIIARVSNDLSSHKINIEDSRMVAREGIFLMELLTDVSRSTLPAENLEAILREHMQAVGIATMFQRTEVFNPKKRVIVFEQHRSLIDPAILAEVVQQAGLPSLPQTPEEAARLLEDLPAEVFHTVTGSLQVSADSLELVHSLQRMGYRTALDSRAFAPVAEAVQLKAGLDEAFGLPLPIDADSQSLRGTVGTAPIVSFDGVAAQDVSVVKAGVRVEFDMRVALDLLNQRVLSKDTLAGVLGSFGAL